MSSQPRVVDATRPGLRVEVAVSEAAELLLSLSTLLGGHGPEDFDLGAERIEQIRAGIPADLAERANEISGDVCAAQLFGLVYETPAPRTVEAFLAHLEALDPLEIQLNLLGYYTRGHHIAAPETIRRAALGDAAAAAELLEAAGAWEVKRRVVERLLQFGGETGKQQLLDVLARWNEAVLEPTLDEIRPLLERDAAEKRELAASLAPSEFVERATGGIQYSPRPEIHELVFFPSYWFRPWVMLAEHKHARLFGYSIQADRAADDPAVGLSELARLYKALGDEKRLALISVLRSGPIALGVAAREVGLSKSTTHHHLAILRQAGLVLIREDEEKSYSLRADRLREVSPLLERATSGSVTRST